MVRDLAKSLDKKIDLIVTGAETELDRTVIDEIGDPLVHLLRNAVDHGVEGVQERIAAGKPETGTINLRAFHSGNHVFIEIEEDGAGINPQKILKSAVKREFLLRIRLLAIRMMKPFNFCSHRASVPQRLSLTYQGAESDSMS